MKSIKNIILFISVFFVYFYLNNPENIIFFIKKNENLKDIIYYIPFIIFGAALLMSILFNNSNIFFLILINIGIYYFYYHTPFILSLNIFKSQEITRLLLKKSFNGYIFYLIIFIPLNYLFLCFSGESGIFNLKGLRKGTFIFLGLFLPLILIKFQGLIDKWGILYLPNENFFKIIPIYSYKFSVFELTTFLTTIFFILIFANKKKTYIIPSLISSLLILMFVFQKNYNFLNNDIFVLKKILPFIFTINSLYFLYLTIIIGYYKAYKDDLTLIDGRRALNENFSKLLGKYCIAMIDIDFFKKFNDTYGHKAGDLVLYNIAQTIESKSSGKVFRFGGEEFTIIYNNKNIKKNFKELDNLRSYISKTKINIGKTSKSKKDKAVKVNISAGIALKNSSDKNPQDVLKRADSLLYNAKKNGRNKVESDIENKLSKKSPKIKPKKNIKS